MDSLRRKWTTRDGLIGKYDYAFLCLPRLPFSAPRKRRGDVPKFYGLHDEVPVTIALLLGFQHALAMLAGIVTVPLILTAPAGSTGLNFPDDLRQHQISVALIVSGLLSAIQITRIKLFGKYYMGTGLLSVVGTSFVTVSIAQNIISQLYANGTCPTSTAADGTVSYLSCPDAYGAILGTSALCSLVEIALSFLPPKALKKLFPPIVTGLAILLIGVDLIGSGFKGWAGGSGVCANRPATGFYADCPNIGAPRHYPWGDAHWIGLGFLVFSAIYVIEVFGSPFMRNIQVVLGLLVGCVVSAALGYWDKSSIDAAPVVDFPWTHTYKLSVYAPAIVPFCFAYVVLAIESIGDVTASCDVSGVPVEGEEFDSRIQGGMLADGFNGLMSALMTGTPMSVFAQNNGVIALTRCANTTVGYACCFWLIVMGVFAKFAAVFIAIPDAVLGGMTTFLFASVATSGIRVLAFLKWTRRDRIIIAGALCFGVGNYVVPNWFSYFFTYSGDNAALRGLMDSVVLIVGSGYVAASIIAIVLNLVLPSDKD
ncbi:purine permease, partial [Zopfochytrium polystomum]